MAARVSFCKKESYIRIKTRLIYIYFRSLYHQHTLNSRVISLGGTPRRATALAGAHSIRGYPRHGGGREYFTAYAEHLHRLGVLIPVAEVVLFGCALIHISLTALLPQGRPEAAQRTLSMLRKMDELGFGKCSNETECETVCPKEITISNIARFTREFFKASIGSPEL